MLFQLPFHRAFTPGSVGTQYQHLLALRAAVRDSLITTLYGLHLLVTLVSLETTNRK